MVLVLGPPTFLPDVIKYAVFFLKAPLTWFYPPFISLSKRRFLFLLLFQYCSQWRGGSWKLQLGLSSGLGTSVPASGSCISWDFRFERRVRVIWCTCTSYHHVSTTTTRACSATKSRGVAGAVSAESRDDVPVRHVTIILPRIISAGHKITEHLSTRSVWTWHGSCIIKDQCYTGNNSSEPLQRLQWSSKQWSWAQNLKLIRGSQIIQNTK